MEIVKVWMFITTIALAPGQAFTPTVAISQTSSVVDKSTCEVMQKNPPAPLNVPKGVEVATTVYCLPQK
jgi:hypothetical protein